MSVDKNKIHKTRFRWLSRSIKNEIKATQRRKEYDKLADLFVVKRIINLTLSYLNTGKVGSLNHMFYITILNTEYINTPTLLSAIRYVTSKYSINKEYESRKENKLTCNDKNKLLLRDDNLHKAIELMINHYNRSIILLKQDLIQLEDYFKPCNIRDQLQEEFKSRINDLTLKIKVGKIILHSDVKHTKYKLPKHWVMYSRDLVLYNKDTLFNIVSKKDINLMYDYLYEEGEVVND